MIGQLKTETSGDFLLAPLDQLVAELFDLAALDAQYVIVMIAAVEFENGVAGFEVVPFDKTRGLELGQHAIHGREPDFLAFA